MAAYPGAIDEQAFAESMTAIELQKSPTASSFAPT